VLQHWRSAVPLKRQDRDMSPCRWQGFHGDFMGFQSDFMGCEWDKWRFNMVQPDNMAGALGKSSFDASEKQVRGFASHV